MGWNFAIISKDHRCLSFLDTSEEIRETEKSLDVWTGQR